MSDPIEPYYTSQWPGDLPQFISVGNTALKTTTATTRLDFFAVVANGTRSRLQRKYSCFNYSQLPVNLYVSSGYLQGMLMMTK